MKIGTPQITKRTLLILGLVGIFLSISALLGKTALAASVHHSGGLTGAITLLPDHQKLFGNKVIQKPADIVMTKPYRRPMDCLAMPGNASNVSNNGIYISYNLDGYVKNTCSLAIIVGGE